jgi:hypothetical protein
MDEYATVQLLSTHCLQKQHFVVQITAKIFEENFLIDDPCQSFSPVTTQFIFNGLLSIKMPLV